MFKWWLHIKKFKTLGTEVICLLAGPEIVRVTHEFERYPRIQRIAHLK